MKRSLFIVAIALMLASSTFKKTDDELAPNMDVRKTQEKNTSSALVENISLNRATQYISDFLNKETFLKDIAQSRALGGTFPKDKFPTFDTDTLQGALMWFCYNSNLDPNSPILFMSVEKKPNLSVYPTKASAANLVRPPNTFTYNGATDTKTIKDYLVGTPQDHDNDLRTITQLKTDEYSADFNTRIGQVLNSGDQKYCNFPFAFFQNSKIKTNGVDMPNGVKAFLNQRGVTYVRYYFGYDETEAENKIRVVLFAVDSNGKNITQINGQPAIILQKSIPPRR